MPKFCQIFFKSLSILFPSPFPVNVSYFNDLSNLCQIFVKSLSNLNPFPVNATSCNDFLKTFITYRSSKKDVETAFHLETL